MSDVDEETAPPRITAAEALEDIDDKPSESRLFEYDFEDTFSRRSIDSEEAWVRLRGLKDHFGHKKMWSWFLMGIIGAMVAFQSVLIWQVGKGALNFASYDWLLPTIMVQYLAQIVGLAVFAVRSFFRAMN